MKRIIVCCVLCILFLGCSEWVVMDVEVLGKTYNAGEGFWGSETWATFFKASDGNIYRIYSYKMFYGTEMGDIATVKIDVNGNNPHKWMP